MTYGFALLTVGTVLLISGIKNGSIADVLRGTARRNVSGPGEVGFRTVLAGLTSGVSEGVAGSPSGIPKGAGGDPTKAEASLKRSHPELKLGIRTVAAIVLSQFPGLTITSTTSGGHATNSYHYKGRAVDIEGDPGEMNEAAQWIARYVGKTLTEGIHNPGLSIDNKRTVPSSFWGAETWAAHANHIHLAV